MSTWLQFLLPEDDEGGPHRTSHKTCQSPSPATHPFPQQQTTNLRLPSLNPPSMESTPRRWSPAPSYGDRTRTGKRFLVWKRRAASGRRHLPIPLLPPPPSPPPAPAPPPSPWKPSARLSAPGAAACVAGISAAVAVMRRAVAVAAARVRRRKRRRRGGRGILGLVSMAAATAAPTMTIRAMAAAGVACPRILAPRVAFCMVCFGGSAWAWTISFLHPVSSPLPYPNRMCGSITFCQGCVPTARRGGRWRRSRRSARCCRSVPRIRSSPSPSTPTSRCWAVCSTTRAMPYNVAVSAGDYSPL